MSGPRIKLTQTQIDLMLRLYDRGELVKEIALKIGVSPSWVSLLCSRYRRKRRGCKACPFCRRRLPGRF